MMAGVDEQKMMNSYFTRAAEKQENNAKHLNHGSTSVCQPRKMEFHQFEFHSWKIQETVIHVRDGRVTDVLVTRATDNISTVNPIKHRRHQPAPRRQHVHLLFAFAPVAPACAPAVSMSIKWHVLTLVICELTSWLLQMCRSRRRLMFACYNCCTAWPSILFWLLLPLVI